MTDEESNEMRIVRARLREAMGLLWKIATDNLPRSAPHWRRSRKSDARDIVKRTKADLAAIEKARGS